MRELEDMLGSEFTVIVFGNGIRRRVVKTLPNMHKDMDNFPQGTIIEINPNKDEKVKSYLLSDLSSITFGNKPAAYVIGKDVNIQYFKMRLSDKEW